MQNDPSDEWLSENINLHDKAEILRWCRLFGCTEQSLVKAVSHIGTSARLVNHYLELNRLKERD